jgi:hypothetical protein
LNQEDILMTFSVSRYLQPFATAAVLLALGTTAKATVFTFASDPFAGTNALTTPGRQIIQNEPSITFDPTQDVFAFSSQIFNVGSQINFAAGTVDQLPTGGANVLVLQTLDDPNNPTAPFLAGNAADVIATQVKTPGAGFFIYFNSKLQLDRLVFSTNLADPTADLSVVARLTNLSGQAGINALSSFSAANFALVSTPEPSTFMLFALGGAFAIGNVVVRRKKQEKSS